MMTPEQVDLLQRALSLLAIAALGGALSAVFFRYLLSCSFLIVSTVVSILTTLAIIFWIAPSGNVPLIIIAMFIFGAAATAPIGGFLLLLAAGAKMDPEETGRAIFKVLAVTFGATFGAALIGLFSGVNFQALGGLLFSGLIILIAVSLGTLFGAISRKLDTAIGMVAAGFWVVYMIYDFNRAVYAYTENTWPAATSIAINVYLDMLNFLVRIAPLFFKDSN